MKSDIESQIKNRISEFVHELDLLVRKSTLEALHGILANGTSAPRPGRTTKTARRPAPARKAGRSAGVDEAASAVLAHVRAHDGQGISAIAAATGVALPVAKKAASRLLASGELKKSGQKRGTVYHVGSGKPARAKAAKRGKRRGRKAKKAA